jgi:hypothetical protein
MVKTPCQQIVWDVLPAIRAALAAELVKQGVSRQEVARLLDTAPSAVSQYLSGTLPVTSRPAGSRTSRAGSAPSAGWSGTTRGPASPWKRMDPRTRAEKTGKGYPSSP